MSEMHDTTDGEASDAPPVERLAAALIAQGAATAQGVERAIRAGHAAPAPAPMTRPLGAEARAVEALARGLLELGLLDESALADAMARAAHAPRATPSPRAIEDTMLALKSAWSGDEAGRPAEDSAEDAAENPAENPAEARDPGADDGDVLAFFRAANAAPAQRLDASETVPRGAEARALLAVANPFDPFAADALRAALGRPVDIGVATPSALKTALDQIAETIDAAAVAAAQDDVAWLRARSEAGPVVRYVDDMIAAAAADGASDIHIEPAPTRSSRFAGAETGAALRVRFRVDGVLRAAEPPAPTLAAAVSSRLKIMAGLDIAERRRPQDGRIRVSALSPGRPLGDVESRGPGAARLDLRVATAPALEGETIVLRLLRRSGSPPTLASIGADQTTRAAIEAAVARQGGLTVVTGPTGAGKTTTLYAILDLLRDGERKLVSIEDPIEYEMAGVVQMQAQPQIGVDFATLLRAALRHDPDAIMVGETRDAETAETAARAALTGHAVLTTLHTEDAVGAVIRLTDMGLEPFLVAATLKTVIAQRLARRLCESCRREAPLDRTATDPAQAALATVAARHRLPMRFYAAPGCAACRGSGANGRIGLFETLRLDEDLAAMIAASASASDLRRAARAAGARSLWEAGAVRVLTGEISVAELRRVVGEPSEERATLPPALEVG